MNQILALLALLVSFSSSGDLFEDLDVAEAFAGAQSVWGPHPTAVTVLIVAGLADPRFVVEVDAIAAV